MNCLLEVRGVESAVAQAEAILLDAGQLVTHELEGESSVRWVSRRPGALAIRFDSEEGVPYRTIHLLVAQVSAQANVDLAYADPMMSTYGVGYVSTSGSWTLASGVGALADAGYSADREIREAVQAKLGSSSL